MTTLSCINLLTRDLELLSRFYIDLFGLEEILAAHTATYREIRAGTTRIGFNSVEIYPLLNLPGSPPTGDGVKSMLTFAAADVRDVDRLLQRAATLGARLIKPAAVTAYGSYQCVLLDPENNCFRINSPM